MANKKRYMVIRTERVLSSQEVEIDLDEDQEWIEKVGIEEAVLCNVQDNYWDYDETTEEEYEVKEIPNEETAVV